MKLRVLTWNIHKAIGGVDRRYDPRRVIDVVRHYAPDVVLLQEVDEGVPRSRYHRQVDVLGEAFGLGHRGYGPNVRLRTGRYGNAILSRWPLVDVCNIDLKVGPKKSRGALCARVRVGGAPRSRDVHLFNLHLGLAGFERAIQLRRFLGHDRVAGLSEREPTLLGGDFNDLWGTLGPRYLAPAGFRRAGTRVNTYPAFRPLRPLDGLYVRGDLVARRCWRSRLIQARQASDHLPLVALLELHAGE